MDVPTAGEAAAVPQRTAWEWEGRAVSPVPAATADEAWALLSDFLAFHKWHPRVAVCRLASSGAAAAAAAAAPGCVRYCEGTPPADGTPADWAHETLLEHDQARRFFRYEMNDNNMGFGAFFAVFRVVPAAAGGCELRWEFECEPVRGTPKEALEARLQAGLDGMAARVHGHLISARGAVAAAGTAGLEAADELKLDNSIAA
ncbi:lachrymatory-factor synthase-like [Hordeum vulgare]|uniref:Lachrymatory-factor synthase n=1 Tax=Hordeum vulgare subsp. vulgare TaxID=112509 RepID=A0A8I7B511_HORVV|nr:lachrymatory-factor synthase-like [Hordeum vulgare subsp. vulgare]KAE8793255.1 lachrymatory-factor synthase-like [Hordeum vulgare]